jgi:hypothetical protein
MSKKNSSDTIVNRPRDLLVGGAVLEALRRHVFQANFFCKNLFARDLNT